MRFFQILSFAILICYSTNVSAQENEPVKKRKIAIADIYIMPGLISQRDNGAPVEAFQKEFPQSKMLNSDLTGFSTSTGWGSYSSSILSLMSGLRFGESTKSSLRFGISYYSANYASADLSKEVPGIADTFTSSQSGEEFYVQKVTNQSYNIYTNSQNLRFDASYIYNLLPEARLSFYTGFGAGTNFSINSHVNISYSETNLTRTEDQNGNSMTDYRGSNSKHEAESYKSKGNYGINAFIPLGIDFLLSKRGDNLFSRTHLLYEFRPGVNRQFGPFGNFTSVQWQHNVGLRFSLN